MSEELPLEKIREIAKGIKEIEDIYALEYPMYTRQAVQYEWKSKIVEYLLYYTDNRILCPDCLAFLSYQQIDINNERSYYCFYKFCQKYRRMTYKRIQGIFCTPTLFEQEIYFTGRRMRRQGWNWTNSKPTWFIYLKAQLNALTNNRTPPKRAQKKRRSRRSIRKPKC